MAQRQIEQHQTAVQAKHAQAETAANQQDAARPAGHPFLRLQQAVGNRLAGAVLQAKLKIGRPNDRFEQEADRVADRIMGPSWSPAMLGTNLTRPDVQPRVQRVCRQCQQEFERPEGARAKNLCPSCRANLLQRQTLDEEEEPEELLQRQLVDENEAEESEEILQTKANPGRAAAAPAHVAGAINGLKGSGRPLPDTTRTFFESRFGRDLGQVRVHTNRQAEQTARAVNARAFTVGQDVVLNTGEYAPETQTGQRLLAHQLPHVVQQAAAGPRLQRQANDDAPASESPQEEAAAPALIVDDEMVTALAPGQMRKGKFLSQLNTAVCATAESALAGTGQSTDGCPYLRFWFDYYRQKSSQHIERAIRRYAPEARQATTAQEYIPFITERVRQGVERWARTGEITGVPEDLISAPPGDSGVEDSKAVGNVQFKERTGGARTTSNPRAIQAQLGKGRSLDGGVRSRMESAFGTGFGHVRIHTDAQAASLSNKHNARAFTIGQHVAFGAGEYRPGTLVGDAILAHELAHTQQQSGQDNSPVSTMQFGDVNYSALEEEADLASANALSSLWTGIKGKFGNLAKNNRPGLKAGLSMQRCSDKCSSGYCWQVVETTAALAHCNCIWKCRKTPSSGGPAVYDPNKRPPTPPSGTRISIGAKATSGGITSETCLCNKLDRVEDGEDLGAVCDPPITGIRPSLGGGGGGKLPGGRGRAPRRRTPGGGRGRGRHRPPTPRGRRRQPGGQSKGGSKGRTPAKKPPPKPPSQLSERQLADEIKKHAKGSERGDQLRYERYKRNYGKRSFEEWRKLSRGGRSGGPNHQKIAKKLLDADGAQSEKTVGSRAADVYWPKGTKGNEKEVYHQIGGLNKRGDPIKRERDAIKDIRKVVGDEADIWFWNKDNPDAPPIKNPDKLPNWGG